MHRTQFAGLTAPDPGESITVDGGTFVTRNPDITDRLLRVGAVTHRHDGHAALPDPVGTCSAVVSNAGGVIPAEQEIFIGYTLIDQYGGETTLSPVVTITTQAQADTSSLAPPVATFQAGSGSLPVNDYVYAQTFNDSAGGETELGPPVFITRPSGPASGQIFLTGLAAGLASGLVSWNLWRIEGSGEWELLQTGATADNFLDTGFNPIDITRTPPPDNSLTFGTNMLTITLPAASGASADVAIASASSINVYISSDGGFQNPSLYQQFAASAAGTSFDVTDLIVGEGAPPPVSQSIPGANQINPDTDIAGNTWKRAVVSVAALPTTGNGSGDVRMVVPNPNQPGVPYTWVPTPGFWTPLATGGGGGGSGTVLEVADASGNVALDPNTIQFVGASGIHTDVSASGGSAIVRVSIDPDNDPTADQSFEVIDASGNVHQVGGVGHIPIEFVGSGGTVVSVSASGGSALVMVTGGPGGGSSGGGSAGAPLASATYAFQAMGSAAAGSGGSLLTTPVPLPDVVIDTMGWFDTTNSRFRPQVAGFYWITGEMVMTGGTTGVSSGAVNAYVYKNGSAMAQPPFQVLGEFSDFYSYKNTDEANQVGTIVYFNGTTDYVDLRLTAATPAVPATAYCRMQGFYLGGTQGPPGAAGAPGSGVVAVEGAGGSPTLPGRVAVVFTGSGGTGVAVSDLGGGSAQVLISASAGGGGGSDPAFRVLASGASGGSATAGGPSGIPIEFVGSGGAQVGVTASGGSAVVTVTATPGVGAPKTSYIGQEENFPATNFGYATTPDKISGLVVASGGGFIVMSFNAYWRVNGAGQSEGVARIVVNDAALAGLWPAAVSLSTPATHTGGTNAGHTNADGSVDSGLESGSTFTRPIFTVPEGLATDFSNPGAGGESAQTALPQLAGALISIWVPTAGTYSVGVQYKQTSGASPVTAQQRRLMAYVVNPAS